MGKALVLISALAVLAWSLLVIVGLIGLIDTSDPRALAMLCFYLAGLGASVGIGFFAAPRWPVTAILISQGLLLMAGVFVLSGGLFLLSFP